MPDSLADVTIDYATGLSASAECSDDLVTLPVPAGTVPPPLKPGCHGVARGTTLEGAAREALHRVGQLLKGVIH